MLRSLRSVGAGPPPPPGPRPAAEPIVGASPHAAAAATAPPPPPTGPPPGAAAPGPAPAPLRPAERPVDPPSTAAKIIGGFITAVFAVAVVVSIGYLVYRDRLDDDAASIDPNDQDPDCHADALAVASSDPAFQWNVAGMDAYEDLYERCLDGESVWPGPDLDPVTGPLTLAQVCDRWTEISIGTPGLSDEDTAAYLNALAGDVDDPDLADLIRSDAHQWATHVVEIDSARSRIC